MDYAAILSAAMSKPVVAERPLGACRVYVSISDKEHAKGVAKAAKKVGVEFQTRTYYGTRTALYIGYDNFGGRELARGTAVVNALNAAGIPCFRDEQGD